MDQTEHDNAEHSSIIVDADPHFIIDATTRKISNPDNKKAYLVQYDHNSERFSFEIDRYIEGHDILLCNRIQVHSINTSGSNRSRHIGLYEITDLAVHPTDDKKACFTWLISENATHYDGTLSFVISFECIKDTEVEYRWNSDVCNMIRIIPGINNNNAVTEVYVDELLKWENYLVEHFYELETELKNTILPDMVDERYIERDFATSAEVAAILALSPGDITMPSGDYWSLQGGTGIAPGTDLNDIKTIGNHCCTSDTTAETLLNCPTNSAFIMKVYYGTGYAYLKQRIETLNEDIYVRFYNTDNGANQWSSWVKLATQSDIDTKISAANLATKADIDTKISAAISSALNTGV